MLGLFGMPGHFELLIVAFIILLLFGNRLPSLMRSLGRGVVEFKAGLHGVAGDDDDDDETSCLQVEQEEKISAD